MRSFLFLIATVLLCVSCEKSNQSTSNLTSFIPRKAAVIIKTENLQSLRTALNNNEFLEKLRTTPIHSFFTEHQQFLADISPKGETLLCYTKIGKDDYDISLITKNHPSFWKSDSTTVTEKAAATASKIKSVQNNKGSYFYLQQDEILVLSTSQLLLENILRENEMEVLSDSYFERAYNATSSKAIASLLVKGDEAHSLWRSIFPNSDISPWKNSFSWTSADLNASQNDLKLSGVVLTKDSTNLRLSLLKNTNPKANKISMITPMSAKAVSAISYQNWDSYKNNQAQYLKLDPSKFNLSEEELFATFDEIGLITLSEGKVIAAVSMDATLSNDALAGNDEIGNFRQLPLYSFKNESAFAKAYQSLLPLPKVKLYCQIEDFFIFAENQESLETIIANYQNNATLSNSTSFKNMATQLSDASSLLHIENLNSGRFKSWGSDNTNKTYQKLDLETYPFLATQLVQERNFMHFNLILHKNENIDSKGAISQMANVKLSADIAMPPQLVKNHRTKGMDIVVQDINNNLYLISNSGKVLWQKELDSPILGGVQQVDLYRNGRLQLAFVTENTFHILDRNGKEVKPFPIAFKDRITQPLAIFDYEKNRNYRFVITQGEHIQMYDKEAKRVNGFTFNKADSEVVLPPKHIRINNKDYIVIAENSGKLHILSRTGSSRIDIAERLKFGDTPIYASKGKFMTYDVNGDLITINTQGKLIETATDFGSDADIRIAGNNTIALRENILSINGNKANLAFGSYSAPKVVQIAKKIYVTTTNTESSQVHVFDSKGTAIKNFPVYGISTADIGLLERNKSLGFVTQGDANSILIYRMN